MMNNFAKFCFCEIEKLNGFKPFVRGKMIKNSPFKFSISKEK